MNYFIEASNLYTTTQVDDGLSVGAMLKHYKGGLYTIVGFAKHTETGEDLVLYVSATESSDVWARPKSMLFEEVTVEDEVKQRFEVIK